MEAVTTGSRPPQTSNALNNDIGFSSHIQGDPQIDHKSYVKPPIYQKGMLLSSAERPYRIGQGQAGERVSFIADRNNYSTLSRQVMGPKYAQKPVSTKVGGPRGDFASEVDQHYATKQQTNYTLKNLSKIFDKQSLASYGQTPSGPIYNIKQYNATYQGGFERGVPTGKGVAHYQDGGYYTGDFHEGDANGQGVYIYPNGSVYEGQFKGSQFNGKGSLVYVDKRMKYDGQFVNGLPQGHGVQTYDEGDRYQGQFNRGVKQGFGTYSWANGLKYEGNWQNGLMHGNGALLQGSNVAYQGQFVKGMKSGHGVFKTDKGSYEGNFDNDYLNGPGSYFWNDGRLYVGNFYKTMMQDDEGKLYYPNGQVASGVWERNHNKLLTNIKNDPSVEGIIKKYRNQHQQGLTYKPVNPLDDLRQSGNVRTSGVRQSDMRMRQGFQSEISSEQGGVVRNRTSNISSSNQVSPLSYEQPRAYNYA